LSCPVAAESMNQQQINEIVAEMKMEYSKKNHDGPKITMLFKKIAPHFRVRICAFLINFIFV
jgi:hypothetical protein